MSDSIHRHVLSILVEDRFGELARIVGLFSGRGFNIDSLAVNRTLEPGFSRVVLATRGDGAIIEQIIKQLNKLLRVRKVNHMVGTNHFERELCIVTVRAATPKAHEELERLLRLTGARVIAHYPSAFTLELTSTSDQVDSLLELLRPLGIRDMVRSAPIALSKPMAEAESTGAESAA
jgi:acetolactate synthase-1/3 small subunit